VWAAVAAVPVFAWEICLAVHLVVRGLQPSAATADPAPADVEALPLAG
jgi:hypothetical protein